jgi:hypothetical protein
MVKKSNRPVPPGLNVPEAPDREYITINISQADNGYVLDAHSNESHIKMVFAHRDELLEAVNKFLDATPDEE